MTNFKMIYNNVITQQATYDTHVLNGSIQVLNNQIICCDVDATSSYYQRIMENAMIVHVAFKQIILQMAEKQICYRGIL